MKSEVNFEKRGRLQDHQTCPVCGACKYDKHTHKLMLIIVFLLLLFTTSAHAQSIPYIFKTLATPATDIDDDKSLLVNSSGNTTQNIVTVIDGKPQSKRNRGISFECGDTFAESISNGIIVGDCTEGAFVRLRTGQIVILAALGDDARGNGVSEDGTVGGEYFTSFGPPNFGGLLHGFTWHRDRGYRTVDYLDPRPDTHTHNRVLAPIPDGRNLGEYYVYADATNEVLEHGYFLESNGTFDTVSLPKSFEHIGGPGAFIVDYPIVIQRWNDATPGLQLFDDDKVYQITGKPAGWIISQIGGSNKDGSFVGDYFIQVGSDMYGPIYELHGFVATQAPVKLAKGNK